MSVRTCSISVYVVGLALSIVVNQVGVRLLVKKMWHYLERHARGERRPNHNPRALTQLLGLTEAVLYTVALLSGAKEFIAVWLALKAAVRWRAMPSEHEGGTGTDNLWLIGSGASVFAAYLSVFIARCVVAEVVCTAAKP
jgi:hypothetical protein